MARYLLAVTPLSGHVRPMVQIGLALQSAGHDVTVLTGPSYADVVDGADLRFVALPDGTEADPPEAAPSWSRPLPTPMRRFLVGQAELASVFCEPLAVQAAALRWMVDNERFDVILADVTFTGALAMLLDGKPRPPLVVCGVGPLTLSSADVPPFGMAWQPQPDVDYRTMTRVTHRVLMRHSQRRFDRALREAGVSRAPVFISDWPRLADGIVQLCVEAFEYPRSDLPASVEFVGPVLPDFTREFRPPHWWSDVTGAPTVVHVTQGTFDNRDLDQLISPTLAALADRDDLLVVATTGGRPGQRFRGAVPRNARITDWLPYSSLMPHVDVMITNGGYGGVQYALAHGVPLIVAGETSDKAEVAARVEFCAAGINLDTAAPSPEAINASVDRIIERGGYRAAAARIQREIEATAPLDAVIAALKRHSAAGDAANPA